MSIARIQKERILEEITRLFFNRGEKPRVVDILGEVSQFFRRNPAGAPLKMPLNYIRESARSNVDELNELLSNIAVNLDVAYDASAQQLSQILMTTTILRTHLDRLTIKRKSLEAKIDDYLFSLYNTDGYFYSVSDTFSDLSKTDTSLSSAYVDTVVGSVILPTISSLTERIAESRLRNNSFRVIVDNIAKPHEVKSPFTGAVDGLSNTIWHTEVKLKEPKEVVGVLTLDIGTVEEPAKISRVEYDPYGIVPVQVFLEATKRSVGAAAETFDFGDRIRTGVSKMVFTSSAEEISQLRITLRKTEPDYVSIEGGAFSYNYIFGAKDLSITEHVYDNGAIFVSEPLSIADELAEENVIDAVSLVTFDDIPPDTSITYYVAPDLGVPNPNIGDFDWRQIDPLGSNIEDVNTIIYFDGASTTTVTLVKDDPKFGEVKMIESDTTAADIFEGINVWRIAKIDQDVIKESIKMDEGINTVKVMYTQPNTPADATAAMELAYWKSYVSGAANPKGTTFSTIDTGRGFFDGADLGENNLSVYAETYLESLSDQVPILKEFQKTSTESKLWDIKIFLNGTQVANLPKGVNSLKIPWKFDQGLNHIALLIKIPEATSESNNPYLGSIDLMTDTDLFQFGSVKLGTWKYVDPFQLQYNETDGSKTFANKTFTIYNGEILSRTKPTTNFKLRYSKAKDQGPTAVRVRADLSRSILNPNITPALEAYRLRFLYA